MIEDAGCFLQAAAVQRAEDHLHQILRVPASLLSQPQHHLLQQELHRWIFSIPLIMLPSLLFLIKFNQSLKQVEFKRSSSIKKLQEVL